mmetsp:Transcript_13358/g.47908  ORF Transcript_13358/g.47908 Transcript_13358/m.47908 type:complete len:264 (-) Transcript_13358:1714-2505(-)
MSVHSTSVSTISFVALPFSSASQYKTFRCAKNRPRTSLCHTDIAFSISSLILIDTASARSIFSPPVTPKTFLWLMIVFALVVAIVAASRASIPPSSAASASAPIAARFMIDGAGVIRPLAFFLSNDDDDPTPPDSMDATAESKDVRFSFDLDPIRRIPLGFFAVFSSSLAAPAAPSPARPALSAAARPFASSSPFSLLRRGDFFFSIDFLLSIDPPFSRFVIRCAPASLSSSSSLSSTMNGTRSETALKSAVPMTSSLVVRCS